MPQVETDRAGESAAPVEQLTHEGAVVYHVTSVASGTTALGANLFPDNSGASFRVWAPNAAAVNVRLTPSDVEPFQTLPLGRDAANPAYWSVDVGGVAAGMLKSQLGCFGGGGSQSKASPQQQQPNPNNPIDAIGGLFKKKKP